MEIENIPISEIIPYEKNPRKNEKAAEIVAKSIKEFGFRVPIILDKKNVIIAGHTRIKAAEKLGITEIPCIRAANLTKKQVKAFRIMDNKSIEYAGWNLDLLKGELEELSDLNYDLNLTGFKDHELDKILDRQIEEEDFEPPKKPKYKIKQGEIWKLGNHRLMCGDATKKEDVDKLMNGQTADMALTDPPYGVDYESGSKMKMKGDTIEKLQELLDLSFKNFNDCLKKGAVIYSCYPEFNRTIFIETFKKHFKLAQIPIWIKDNFTLGNYDYHWQYEGILYGWKTGAAHNFYGGRDQSTNWEFPRPRHNKEHPTMKPVELCIKAIKNSSRKENLIIDFFGGSGSTLIAAEQTNRKCYMIEIDLYYCSVIIERWEKITGKKAKRLK